MRNSLNAVCKNCGADDWYVWSNGGRSCAPCKQVKGKKWVSNNREKVLAYSKKSQDKHKDLPRIRKNQHLKRTYGITIEEYEALFIQQGESCAICYNTSSATTWHLDHDHKSSKVRGILCHNCNLMIGHAKDNISTLKRAMAYLEERLSA
jgi:alpha-amylase/alpha-mannosidase (GH57 family)